MSNFRINFSNRFKELCLFKESENLTNYGIAAWFLAISCKYISCCLGLCDIKQNLKKQADYSYLALTNMRSDSKLYKYLTQIRKERGEMWKSIRAKKSIGINE